MNVIIKEVPTPMMNCFAMLGNPDFKALEATRTVRVVASPQTKTRISTTIQFGSYRVKINFQVEGIKTHMEESNSFMSYGKQVNHYFVKSKKQDAEVYKEYVKKVVVYALNECLNVKMDEVTVELELGRF